MEPLVFDLDGTLLDSAPDIHAALNAALGDLVPRPFTQHEVAGFVGRGAPVLVHRACTAQNVAPSMQPLVLSRFLEIYETAVELSALYPGVMDALQEMSDRGHALAICTNKPMAPTRFVLDHFGLTPLMQAIIGGDSLPQRKPDPAPLFESLRLIGARTCLYIGDSETDCETAQAARMPFLLFTEGYRHAQPEDLPHRAKFSDWTQFPTLVASVLAQTYPQG